MSAFGAKRTAPLRPTTSAFRGKGAIGETLRNFPLLTRKEICRRQLLSRVMSSRLNSANGEGTCLEMYGAVRRDGQCCLKLTSQASTLLIRKTHTITWRRTLSAEEG